MYRVVINIIILLSLALCPSWSFAAASRLKDIVMFEGIRENLLIGYGLVVGLNGTGDNLSNSAFTQQGIIELLEKLGVNTRGANLKTKNIAAVTVTAKLPTFARQGSTIDVNVSTLGDSKSLQGGTLLATPLLGADGEVYAVAQGQIAIGGFQATGNSGTTISKGVSTNGFVASGAIIEKELDFELASLPKIDISLRNPDITTSQKIADVINQYYKTQLAYARDPGTVTLEIPIEKRQHLVAFLSEIENFEVIPDYPAKIIIDEASGTIVIGENVKISKVAIAQGNLTISIKETQEVSQPNPFAPESSQTIVVPKSDVQVREEKGMGLVEVQSNTNLKELVDGLNALGVLPRDLITIMQNIKAAGALQAEIEAR
jgi:flagellar P-ring protein precursor FlgI